MPPFPNTQAGRDWIASAADCMTSPIVMHAIAASANSVEEAAAIWGGSVGTPTAADIVSLAMGDESDMDVLMWGGMSLRRVLAA